jgi:hypothetical protein
MKLKKYEYIYKINDRSKNLLYCGDGSLARFLEIPHTGVQVGFEILLDILYPASKKIQDIKDNTLYLMNIWSIKTKKEGLYSDQRFYRDLHFHVNGKGLVSYIAVPESWMQKLEKRSF